MPERVSKEEMLARAAIIKAKESIQEAEHLGIVENKDPVMGEEIKVKRPKKKPAEEKVDNPVSTDDINSGYGHVGSKEYFGKGLDSVEKLSPQLEGILDELTQAIQRVQGKDKRELEEKMHEILSDIKDSPRVLSSAPSMDSEFRSEADIDERLDKEDEEEEEKIYLDKSVEMVEGWKTLLKFNIDTGPSRITMVTCPTCRGLGRTRPMYPNPNERKPEKDDGKGNWKLSEMTETCRTCGGSGKITQNEADKMKRVSGSDPNAPAASQA